VENKDIEINENIELEYEIQIPKFLEFFTKIASENYNEKKKFGTFKIRKIKN
jgi:hypothetical protein